jgi:hypothetical protein
VKPPPAFVPVGAVNEKAGPNEPAAAELPRQVDRLDEEVGVDHSAPIALEDQHIGYAVSLTSGRDQCDPRIGKLSESRGVNLLSPPPNLRLYEIIDIFGFVLPNNPLRI